MKRCCVAVAGGGGLTSLTGVGARSRRSRSSQRLSTAGQQLVIDFAGGLAGERRGITAGKIAIDGTARAIDQLDHDREALALSANQPCILNDPYSDYPICPKRLAVWHGREAAGRQRGGNLALPAIARYCSLVQGHSFSAACWYRACSSSVHHYVAKSLL